MSEKEIIEEVQSMAEESLPPSIFEKWEEVRKWLEINREALN